MLKCVIRGRKASRWGRRDGGGEGVQRKEHLSGGKREAAGGSLPVVLIVTFPVPGKCLGHGRHLISLC